MGEGRVREFGMDVYTVLCLKWITNKDLLYGKGTLLNVMWQPGREGAWGRMDTCMAESVNEISSEFIRKPIIIAAALETPALQ